MKFVNVCISLNRMPLHPGLAEQSHGFARPEFALRLKTRRRATIWQMNENHS